MDSLKKDLKEVLEEVKKGVKEVVKYAEKGAAGLEHELVKETAEQPKQ